MCVQDYDDENPDPDESEDSTCLKCDGCMDDARHDEFGEDETFNDYDDDLISMPDGTCGLPDGSNMDYVCVKLGSIEGEE
jgi:hypothetical protein